MSSHVAHTIHRVVDRDGTINSEGEYGCTCCYWYFGVFIFTARTRGMHSSRELCLVLGSLKTATSIIAKKEY